MSSALRRLVIVALLLIPSAYCLWRNLDLPKFCEWHDDCVYFASSKSLVDGGGYRITSLPGEPAQTKYPPLYPLLLSVAWRIQPNFPENLGPAAMLSWLPLPVFVWLLMSYYPRLGFTGWRMWTLLALVAVSPYTLLFSTTLLSEPLFAALLIGSLLLADRAAERDGPRLAAVAGLVMGFAYLARSTGIVALGTMPLFFLMRRRPRHAIAFAGAMLPFVAGWMTWTRMHQTHTSDPMLMYYIDYFGYEIYNVGIADLPVLLWKNLDSLLNAFGSMILPAYEMIFFVKMVKATLGIAVIMGLMRMIRSGHGLAYLLFALGNCALLLIWHFPPDPRMIFPLLPLLIAGFWTEMEFMAGMIRAGMKHKKKDQRIAAWGFATVVTIVLILCAADQAQLSFLELPHDGDVGRKYRAQQQASYEWVRNNTDPGATVLTTQDPLFYLNTNRHAIRFSTPPKFWYHEDHKAIVDVFRNAAAYAREHQMGYFYNAGVELISGVTTEDKIDIDKAIRTNPQLKQVFGVKTPAVYKVDLAGPDLAGRTQGGPVEDASH